MWAIIRIVYKILKGEILKKMWKRIYELKINFSGNLVKYIWLNFYLQEIIYFDYNIWDEK